MSYLNKVMVIGNVGKEPKIFHFQNGNMKASFSIATTKRYRDTNDEQKELTTWVNCTAFGGLAEVIENYVNKGSQIFVEGELSVSTFTDQQGNKKSVTEVRVSNMQILVNRNAGGNNSNKSSGFATGDGFEDEEGDIPF